MIKEVFCTSFLAMTLSITSFARAEQNNNLLEIVQQNNWNDIGNKITKKLKDFFDEGNICVALSPTHDTGKVTVTLTDQQGNTQQKIINPNISPSIVQLKIIPNTQYDLTLSSDSVINFSSYNFEPCGYPCFVGSPMYLGPIKNLMEGNISNSYCNKEKDKIVLEPNNPIIITFIYKSGSLQIIKLVGIQQGGF